jgi:LPXTG-motif cell wall-anchored protein
MKRMRMVIALVMMVVAANWGHAAAQGATASVSIKDFQYDPVSLPVSLGTTVTWTNNGAVDHTVTAADGSWDSGTLAPGATWSRTFDSAATVAYYCIFHGSATGTGMAGNLVVAAEQPTAAPAPPTAAPSGPTPSISAGDQPISNNMITVAKVVAAQDGWIAVHKNGPDGKLLVTPIVGKVAIKAGTTENVKVELTESFAAGDVLYPMLHIDAGTLGTYEFPGPDSPVQVDGNVVVTKLTVTASAPSAPVPSISAGDQPISNNMITVAKVVAAQDGWIAVHKNGPDGKLLVTPIVGKAAIKAGTTENVKVELTESFAAGDVLYPMLHIDAGTLGTYEFPGPDSPVQVDGNIVLAKLTVVAAPAVPPSLPNTSRPADASLWIAALALALLLGGMLVLRRRRAA